MNKEFEEWLDREIRKRSPDGTITKAVLADIITKALTDLANIEEMKKALERIQALKDMVAQMKTSKDELIEKVASCCGRVVGDSPCAGYDCEDLRRILVQLQAAISTGEAHVQ